MLKVVLLSAGSFVFLFALAKFQGKKKIAQLTFVDYVTAISIGSIAAEFAVDMEHPWYIYVVAMAVYFALDMIINFAIKKSKTLKNMLHGRPIVLIEAGKIQYNNLKKSRLTVNDLLAMLRLKNYFDITKVSYALFEANGELSVLPIGSERPITALDINAPIMPARLIRNVIIDGSIVEGEMKYIKKDKAWLYKKLGKNPGDSISGIFLAVYDENTDELTVMGRSS